MRPLIRTMLLLIGMFVAAGATCASAQTPSPPGAKVYFINLKDGAELDSPFWCSSAFLAWASHLPV